ncbi:adenylate kinase 9-like [Brachionus plicatilis]|uniref:Adenylate kinase 9-like n=1 Tax=Brachionus plicatilis TaxID=10195 RepID=A0A3M7QUX1_BRAPC|nr:adenylate kinase 9-like [Brachionus plicatilis]
MADEANPETKPSQEIHVQTGASVHDLNLKNQFPRKFTLQDFLNLDPFDEDEAEQRFLTSKPTCFLVVGKPGSGKSTIAKKLAAEWKAELVNPTDLILTSIKNNTDLGKKAQDILLKGEAIPESIVAHMIDEKINSPEVAHHGYVLDGFPSQSENNFDIGQQMEMMKNWKLQPDFIINLRIPDKDLTRRRVHQKVDPISGNLYIKEMYAPNKPKAVKKEETETEEGDEEEAEEMEEERPEEPQDEFFAVIANDVVERLVIRPEDTLSYVQSSLGTFKEALLRVLEDQMANMDQSYLIELDSNLSPTILIKQLLLRLESYPIRKAAKVLRMSEPVEVNEEEAANTDHFVDTIEIEENLSSLQSRKKLSGKFKWRRSKCAFYCPVSLKDGKIVSGKPDYAASFLDKIYLMADENRLRDFLKNPRPYLRLPQPRAPCKLSILGTPFSGKTSLSALLAKKYNASVIDMKSLMEPRIKKANDELRDRVTVEATQSAIDQIKQKFREKLEQEKVKREQEQAERAAMLAETQEAQQDQESQEVRQPAEEKTELSEQEAEDKQNQNEDNFDIQKEESIVNEPIDYSKLDPNVTYSEENDITVNPDHPDIQFAIEKALEDLAKQQFNLPPSEYIKVLQDELDRIRKNRAKIDPTAANDGGWILDNFPNDSEQLNAMAESNIIPDTFLILQDSSDDSSILSKRWYQLNKDEIDQRITKRLADEAISLLVFVLSMIF